MEGLGWEEPLAPGQLHPHGDGGSSVTDRGAGRGWGALPPAHLLRGAGRWLGGGIRAPGSHFPGGSTTSSSRNASIPAMRSSRCSACRATLWKSCGEMLWFSHHVPAFIHLEPSSQPAAITRKQTLPLQGNNRGPASCKPTQAFGFLSWARETTSSALHCSLQRSPGVPIPGPSHPGCCARLTSSVSSVAMALPTSW